MNMRISFCLLTGLIATAMASGQAPTAESRTVHLERYKPLPAPTPSGLLLKKGDRLAICGDSITEQKMYSRIMEDYLTVCVPELGVTVRQYGWGGETASGFLARMTNDCLRFKPTIATTCYGMNDHEYRAFEDRIGDRYREKSTAIVESFKANGARVVLGSPGCVGKIPFWQKRTNDTLDDLNMNLCDLRNIDIEIADKEKVGFADVFWPMLNAGVQAQKLYGTNYAIAGPDGVHPSWAGHAVMAYAFLKGLGLDGDIGTFIVDLKTHKMTASKGHEVLASSPTEYHIKSSRYPLCSCTRTNAGKPSYPACATDNWEKDTSIRSAMTLIPFNHDLNRFTLQATGAEAKKYRITWGTESKTFSAEQLAKGINLTDEFSKTPFAEAFAKVDAAVAAKQAYETTQIKQKFRSKEANENMEAVMAETEKQREPLAAAIKAAFVPVEHAIAIVAE